MTSVQPRADFARLQARNHEPRSVERLRAHYELEAALAARLRNAPGAERPVLYQQLYDTLFSSLPDHPQNTKSRAADSDRIARQRALLRPLLPGRGSFLEIGCGDAALSFAVAPHCAAAYGVDVTDRLIDPARAPANFRFVPTAGTALDLPARSIDLAYSNQLMEHLHPDDAAAQLREIHRVLRPGGAYLCRTPSRLTGPHDISVYFAYEAQGFHLREYDYRSLAALFRAAGFRRMHAIVGARQMRLRLPVGAMAACEAAIAALPAPLRRRVVAGGAAHAFFGLDLLGIA
ncbi:MAG: class I SAM-dependent methyltransferase [Alphaproteobacteria bacterium]|nr:class I SAM-dependent methyltransferase [Alphaproteobacteria bacterium]